MAERARALERGERPLLLEPPHVSRKVPGLRRQHVVSAPFRQPLAEAREVVAVARDGVLREAALDGQPFQVAVESAAPGRGAHVATGARGPHAVEGADVQDLRLLERGRGGLGLVEDRLHKGFSRLNSPLLEPVDDV